MAKSQANLARLDDRPYWPAPKTDARIPGLDGVRAVAILLVIAAHLGDPAQSYVIHRDQLGLLGVQIFFVLSGFLITTLLLDEEQAHGRISMRGFYLRRAFRIFPAAYAFIAAMMLLSFANVFTLTGRDLLHAVTYTTNYYSYEERSWQLGHLWSLAVEEQFYLLWPLALCCLRGRKRIALLLFVICVCPLIRFAYINYLPEVRVLVTESFETTADALAFGCLLAMARPWLHQNPWYARAISNVVMPLLLAGAIFVINQSGRIIELLGPLQYTMLYFTIALMLDAVISQSGGLVRWTLNTRVAIWLGGLSYSLYLWQQPFMDHESTAWWNEAPLNVLLVVGAAMLSYHAVEKPFQRMRRRLEGKGQVTSKAGLVGGLSSGQPN